MYLDFLIEIPDVSGKITRRKKGRNTYINYEYSCIYDPDRKYNIPQRVTIGKESEADDRMMVPNQNFLTYFPEVELPEQRYNPERSGYIRIGAFIVIRKIIEEYRMPLLQRTGIFSWT